MNLITKSIIACSLIFGGTLTVSGQEYIVPLETNPALLNSKTQELRKGLSDVSLELPVIEDFSYSSVYPDPAIWADKYAFINSSFAVNPPSIGVATLDAVDWTGSVYWDATLSPVTFDADFLTSNPINLDYLPSDNIYLSFFYQPQGNGLMPSAADSLCLDFYKKSTDSWVNVWRAAGDTLHAFKQVMIAISDTSFLKDGFRFGFRNKASLPQNSDYKDKRGNVDHWNIDYIRLDKNRSSADTVIRDVAFSKMTPSMLKRYEAIPWDHFKVAYNTIYQANINLNYFNNDTASRNISRSVEIYDQVWDENFAPGNSITQDILPGTTASVDITSIYPFQFTRGDTASFRVKSWLRTDEFDNKKNDTLYRTQIFKDYFAYDDGSAERAYGLRGQGTSNGLIAVRFDSYIPDELGGVDVYFTQLKDSLNLGYYFKFMVWNDIDGMPGDLIYEDDMDYTAVYSDVLNKYARFTFGQTVNVSGKFYVGILQYNQFLLNIGLDVNKASGGNLLYNLGSEWKISSAPGSLMLRPYVKRNYSTAQDERIDISASVKIWPNPADDFIRIELPSEISENNFKISIFDITGKKIKAYSMFKQEIFTGNLPEGMYFMTFSSSQGAFKTEKFLIKR